MLKDGNDFEEVDVDVDVWSNVNFDVAAITESPEGQGMLQKWTKTTIHRLWYLWVRLQSALLQVLAVLKSFEATVIVQMNVTVIVDVNALKRSIIVHHIVIQSKWEKHVRSVLIERSCFFMNN